MKKWTSIIFTLFVIPFNLIAADPGDEEGREACNYCTELAKAWERQIQPRDLERCGDCHPCVFVLGPFELLLGAVIIFATAANSESHHTPFLIATGFSSLYAGGTNLIALCLVSRRRAGEQNEFSMFFKASMIGQTILMLVSIAGIANALFEAPLQEPEEGLST